MDADLSSVGGNANEGYSQPFWQVDQGFCANSFGQSRIYPFSAIMLAQTIRKEGTWNAEAHSGLLKSMVFPMCRPTFPAPPRRVMALFD